MTQNIIHIEWLHDDWDCETCGWSWAEGARVTLNGETFLELIPSAHCFGGDHWSNDAVYLEIMKKLGYTITEG